MTLLSSKKLTGWAVAAGAVLIAGMAVAPPAHAVDDLPMVEDGIGMPPPAPRDERSLTSGLIHSSSPYRPGPYGQGSICGDSVGAVQPPAD